MVEAAIISEAQRLEARVDELSAAHRSSNHEAETAKEALAAQAKEAAHLRRLLEAESAKVSDLNFELDEVRRESTEERERRKESEDMARSEQGELRTRLTYLEQAAAARTKRVEDVRAVSLVLSMVAVALTGGVFFIGRALVDRVVGGPWVSWTGVMAAAALAWLLVADILLQTRPSMRDGSLHRALIKGRKGLVVLFVGVVSSIIASAIWDSARGEQPVDQPKGSPGGGPGRTLQP